MAISPGGRAGRLGRPDGHLCPSASTPALKGRDGCPGCCS